MSAPRWTAVLLVLCALAASAAAGSGSHHYETGEDIALWVDRVGPFSNPQEFYMYHGLPFCRPEQTRGKLEGLGESLLGYELRRSVMAVSFGVPTRSGEVCEKKLNFEEATVFAYAVQNQFWYQMYLDDIPLYGLVGEEIDVNGQKALYIFSHLHFDISKNGDQVISANLTSESAVLIQEGAEITFTYSVSWSESTIKFSDRFQRYLDAPFFEHQIHWFSLFNSAMLLVFLVGLVGMIVLRTSRKEYVPLGEEDPDDDITDESNWKLVHRDVFRPPARLVLFSAVVGCGFQLLSALVLVLVLGALGAHYHESRGSILSAFVVWYVLSSFVGGYFSGSTYAKNKGNKWIKTALITALLYPLLFLVLVGVMNSVTFYSRALSYVPVGTIVLLVIVWALLCVPICLLGTFFGRHLGKSALQSKQRPVNQLPRMLPALPWYLQSWALVAWTGLLPFSTIFVELFFVYTSVFHYKFYYVYGLATVVFLLLLLVTMAVNVVATYFLLNNEYHKWHWTSFKTGLGVAAYIMVYAAYYYVNRTAMSGVLQLVQYFVYNALLAATVGLICTSVGFLASRMFVNRIYSGLKFD